MLSIKTRFITRIRRNLDAWRAGELDFVTFNECQRETWAAIRNAGKDIEAAVVSALMGSVLLADLGLLQGDEHRTIQIRAVNGAAMRPGAHRYCGELRRTPIGPALRVSPAEPGSHHAEHRQVAALIYGLAADMERRSHELEAHWTISPNVETGQVVIELAGDHEAELADEFIANIMSHHQLI